MIRLFKLQFLGPLVLFLATLSAELAAGALAYWPSSETLWYLNIEIFRVFQRSHSVLTQFIDIDGFQLFGIALPIFALACAGLWMRSRLPLAVSAQFSVGYATVLLFSWQAPAPTSMQASLQAMAVTSGDNFYMILGILGSCLLSAVISHILYLCGDRPPKAA
ncbi:hypothetical protein [Rhodoplanes sp. Z2-YC6860]|uniref:hypothetical protein n=1 Tax=Rhodoplanes sp. Z2-YC6860 TaxID=674703 RepID=UPI00078CAD56|nr:hypothetical protein [Rhodoplanes sp. Z2-YC6860]AMN43693.1 hypothetical protein RHPLAN_52740 [Rhodoplanes sp. Z2-YC6860]